MPILSKEEFKKRGERRVELVKLASGDEVYIRTMSNFRQSQREYALYDSSGRLLKEQAPFLRAHAIIDQVCIDEDGQAMFDETDLEQLANSDNRFVCEVYQAINEFNERTLKKSDPDRSEDSSENCAGTTDSRSSARSSKNGEASLMSAEV